MGELMPADGKKIASKWYSENNKKGLWSKTRVILTAVGLERISLSKKKTEPRRKEWDIRNILGKEINKTYW